MNRLLDVWTKVSTFFASPYLPLDREYSYGARHAEAGRMRSLIVRGLV